MHTAYSRKPRPATAPSVQEEASGQETHEAFLSGIKPVRELLEQDPSRIDALFLRKGHRSAATDAIMDLCRTARIRFTLVDGPTLDRLCPAGHQGVAARLIATGFADYEELLDTASDAPLPLLVALDQVQDTGNAGTLARTLYALGGAGLILPRHNGVYLGAAARRAAAGALERLPVARVTNMSRALDTALDRGYTIYAAARNGDSSEISILEASLHLPAILVLGSEDKGIRPQVLKRCQHTVYIPMLRDFDSLNVAQAGGIAISAFLRQHLKVRKS